MTRSELRTLSLLVVLAVGAMCGCEIITEEPPVVDFRPAFHVVINEVFALPPSPQSQYSWVELLNPTRDTVDIGRWTLTFTTSRQQTVTTVVLDSLYQFRLLLSSETGPPTQGVYDVAFARQVLISPSGISILESFPLAPNGLYTLVSNEDRLLDHTEWGPGPENSRFIRFAFPTIDSLLIDSTFQYSRDSVVAISYQTEYIFQLQSAEQLVLKDGNGQVVDVVRYGNYVYPGPGPDPYPGNQSLGVLPPYESIARYAGGFFTANTAFDFYVTNPEVRPIPHWYSQRYRTQ
jgi:hypothetical protein